MDMDSIMMQGVSHIPGYELLWAEAVKTARDLKKRMFSKTCKGNSRTSLEIISEKCPELSHIRNFVSY